MISVASNVLEDISRRAEDLKQTLITAGTRGLPGYSAYASALRKRVAASPPSESTPSVSSSPVVERKGE